MSTGNISSSSLTTTETFSPTATERGVWSEDEHDKFLVGLKMFPKGPWRKIAELVGTRSARQVQTHAQKYYEKVERRVRGLRKDRKHVARSEHRLDQDAMQKVKIAEGATEDIVKALHTTDLPGETRHGESEELLDLKPDEVLRWWEGNIPKRDDLMMWNSDAVDTDNRDPLPDVDSCYLAYLIQILDSNDTTEDECL
ncbi:Myb-like dna-binding protein, partial [Globisporangium splendens]